MKKYVNLFILVTFSIGLIIVSNATYAIGDKGKSINVFFNKINVSINGVNVIKKGEYYSLLNGEKIPCSILYQGTTYLPIRKVSEMFNFDIEWDGSAENIKITDNENIVQDIGIKNNNIDNDEFNLWDKTVKKYLSCNIWNKKYSYDSCHYLMIPLHAAFRMHEENWQMDFVDMYKRFVCSEDNISEFNENSLLNKLHFYYLASQFIVLSAENNKLEYIPQELVDLIYDEIYTAWEIEPAWQWSRRPFIGGIKERLRWKLNTTDVNKSYYKAIIDEEKFMFAIAADLKAYEHMTGYENEHSKSISNIVEMALLTFQDRVVYQNNGGWLFQPGLLTDHNDYVYVGQQAKYLDMGKSPISDIAEDTSHSHRMALWLDSLASAYLPSSKERDYFCNLKKGLEVQFFEKVLVEPSNDLPVYLTNNFMDGRNGIYRWGYATQGKNNGYGPYELSGTFTLGWWAFLESDRISEVYSYMVKQFPLSSEAIEIYVGPNTTRERHDLVTLPNAYTNGFIELIIRLASKLY